MKAVMVNFRIVCRSVEAGGMTKLARINVYVNGFSSAVYAAKVWRLSLGGDAAPGGEGAPLAPVRAARRVSTAAQ